MPSAASALGGGGRLPSSDAKRSQQVVWYVRTGDQDLARTAAEHVNQSLAASEVKTCFKFYANFEHLVVFQAAIDDAFEFLDYVLRQLPYPADRNNLTPP